MGVLLKHRRCPLPVVFYQLTQRFIKWIFGRHTFPDPDFFGCSPSMP
jgi:hypothetical protein